MPLRDGNALRVFRAIEAAAVAAAGAVEERLLTSPYTIASRPAERQCPKQPRGLFTWGPKSQIPGPKSHSSCWDLGHRDSVLTFEPQDQCLEVFGHSRSRS